MNVFGASVASCFFETSVLTTTPFNLQPNTQLDLQVTARDSTGQQPQPVQSPASTSGVITTCQVAPNDYIITTQS
jgi:hypothetical protein